MMVTLERIGSLDLDEIYEACNKILVCNRALWDKKTPLKGIFFSWFEYTVDKGFLKFGDIEIKKRVSSFQEPNRCGGV